mgnify:CR=1 FL=1
MKPSLRFPLLALAGGLVCFFLRLWQLRTGFEPDTDLAIPGALAGQLLLAALAVLILVTVLSVRSLSAAPSGALFAAGLQVSKGHLAVLLAGLLLLGVSGILHLMSSALFLEDWIASLLEGFLILASVFSFLPVVRVCQKGGSLSSSLLLTPAVCSVVELVLAYRTSSVNPVLQSYYVDLLALAALTLAYYRLSAFAFRCGQLRRFTLYAVLSVVLCLASTADTLLYNGVGILGSGWSGTTFFLGSALVMLSSLSIRLSVDPGMIFPSRT